MHTYTHTHIHLLADEPLVGHHRLVQVLHVRAHAFAALQIADGVGDDVALDQDHLIITHMQGYIQTKDRDTLILPDEYYAHIQTKDRHALIHPDEYYANMQTNDRHTLIYPDCYAIISVH